MKASLYSLFLCGAVFAIAIASPYNNNANNYEQKPSGSSYGDDQGQTSESSGYGQNSNGQHITKQISGNVRKPNSSFKSGSFQDKSGTNQEVGQQYGSSGSGKKLSHSSSNSGSSYQQTDEEILDSQSTQESSNDEYENDFDSQIGGSNTFGPSTNTGMSQTHSKDNSGSSKSYNSGSDSSSSQYGRKGVKPNMNTGSNTGSSGNTYSQKPQYSKNIETNSFSTSSGSYNKPMVSSIVQKKPLVKPTASNIQSSSGGNKKYNSQMSTGQGNRYSQSSTFSSGKAEINQDVDDYNNEDGSEQSTSQMSMSSNNGYGKSNSRPIQSPSKPIRNSMQEEKSYTGSAIHSDNSNKNQRNYKPGSNSNSNQPIKSWNSLSSSEYSSTNQDYNGFDADMVNDGSTDDEGSRISSSYDGNKKHGNTMSSSSSGSSKSYGSSKTSGGNNNNGNDRFQVPKY